MNPTRPFASGRTLTGLALILSAFAGAALPWTARAEDQPLWELSTDSDIVFQRITPLGTLLVSTDNELTVIDPASGRQMWRRGDVKKLAECHFDAIPDTPYGLIDFGDGSGGKGRQVELIDLQTGLPKWDSGRMSLSSSRGSFLAPDRGVLLLLGVPTHGGKPVLVAADLETGAPRWRQEALFARPLELYPVEGSGSLFRRFSVQGGQPALFEESAAILWLNRDGPMKIDLATGNKLWVAPALKGRTPPALRSGSAPMLAVEGRIYVPFERSLLALDAGSGAGMWRRARRLEGAVAQMALTAQGLLVRGTPARNAMGRRQGRAFVDLLDPATGASRWKKPYRELGITTPFEIRDDRLYLASEGRLLEIDLADGAGRTLARFEFKGDETPTALEVTADGFLLASDHNLMAIANDGSIRYHAHYGAPGSGGRAAARPDLRGGVAPAGGPGAALAAGASPEHPILTRRREEGRNAAGFASVLTRLEEKGRSGAGLVKIERASGREAARLLLGDHASDYEVDPVDGRVFLRRSEREVVCFSF